MLFSLSDLNLAVSYGSTDGNGAVRCGVLQHCSVLQCVATRIPTSSVGYCAVVL